MKEAFSKICEIAHQHRVRIAPPAGDRSVVSHSEQVSAGSSIFKASHMNERGQSEHSFGWRATHVKSLRPNYSTCDQKK